MAFLIDSIKDRFGSDSNGDSDGDGFDDMNYLVGNTSGLDIGQVPGPIDQRIGRMSQIGGEIMEVQITNPTTFQIDRREILNVIEQLDLDVTLHGDPNIGFTGAYATRAQQAAGFNIVHRYMKRYLEQMAAFKWEIDKNDSYSFDLGYVNMHASNEQVPSLEERLASDVSMDPFGTSMIEFEYSEGNGSGAKNIWKNEDFMEDLFDYWFLEVVDRPSRYYDPQARPGIFSSADDDFRERWSQAQEEIADRFFEKTREGSKRPQEEKRSLFQTAARTDTDVGRLFLTERDKLEFEGFSYSGTFKVEEVTGQDDDGNDITEVVEKDYEVSAESFEELLEKVSVTTGTDNRNLFTNPRELEVDINALRKGNTDTVNAIGLLDPQPDQMGSYYGEKLEEISQNANSILLDHVDDIIEALDRHIENLWKGEYGGNGVSINAKISSLSSNRGIQRNEIWERAEDIIEEDAKETFSSLEWDAGKRKILKQLASGQTRDELLKESRIFFNIMPAWMQNAEDEAVRFIWDEIVDEDFENYSEYREWLNDKRENQLDVIAAVGCAYIWGHWTQIEDKFEKEAFKETIGEFEEPDIPEEGVESTWIEWMNRFGLKVNLEAMYGDPGQLRRVWRPKDIAVVCHAINMTARKRFDEEEWHEDHDDRSLVKFTIDMEHTASYGVDPYEEIKDLIDQESHIAENGYEIGIDGEKPLSRIVKTYHLTKPGWEQQQGHRHGPFARGDVTLYSWLYKLIENGFARNEGDEGIVMFEVGGEYREEMYVIRVAMDMIERGIEPEDLNPNAVSVEGSYENVEESLQARFFGMDKGQVSSEMAKIEEHAFDPIQNLLEAEQFDYTYSSSAALQNDNRPGEFQQEEYR